MDIATISATIRILKTVSSLDAATIASVIAWVQTNVKDKLPADCSLDVAYNIVP